MSAREPTHVDTINELKIWLEGRFELIAASHKSMYDDMHKVRERLHEISNHVTTIISLNVPGKLDELKNTDVEHNTRLDKLEHDGIARRSTLAAIKASYTIAGAAIGSMLTLVLEFYRAFGK